MSRSGTRGQRSRRQGGGGVGTREPRREAPPQPSSAGRRGRDRHRRGRQRRRRRWWLFLLLPFALVGAAAAAVLGVFVFFYVTGSIPQPGELVVPNPSQVVSASEEHVTRLDPAAVRKNVELDPLPDHVPEAVLAAEDRGFYSHRGFDPRRIVRAFWVNVTAGEVRQGASTITQQLVNIGVMEEDADRNVLFKLREVALAIRMEQEYDDKDLILELYLNSVPFGRGAVGIEAAAQTYFQKPAHHLDVNEAAVLGGIIAAPSAWDPQSNPTSADRRRVFVLGGMAERGWLSAGEAREIATAGLPAVNTERPVSYGFEGYYVNEVRRQVAAIFGDEERDILIGLSIHTYMDEELQQLAQETIATRLGQRSYTGALVAMDPRDGAVRALVGGEDYNEQQFNAATQARRLAGSAFKTFGLLAFIDEGYSPNSRFPAPSEITIDFGSEYGGSVEVSNFGNAGYGSQTVRQATSTSTNTVYMGIANEVGPDAVRDAAVRAGIAEEDVEEVPSLVLGTGAVSVLNMAEAYATIAAGGVHRSPQVVRRIEDIQTGETLWEAEPDEERRFDENVAAVTTDLLRGVVDGGTATAARIGRPAAGKTGTTNDHRDAWFVGYVPQLVTAVWVGNLDNSPLPGITGGAVPAPIWAQFMRQAVADLEIESFPTPDLSGLQGVYRAPAPQPTPEARTQQRRRYTPPPQTGPTQEEEAEPEAEPQPEPAQPDPPADGDGGGGGGNGGGGNGGGGNDGGD
jgi:penicillin-binding protein 1A